MSLDRNLIEVVSDPVKFSHHREVIGRRGVLRCKAVYQMPQICLTGQTASFNLFLQSFSFLLIQPELNMNISFSHMLKSFLSLEFWAGFVNCRAIARQKHKTRVRNRYADGSRLFPVSDCIPVQFVLNFCNPFSDCIYDRDCHAVSCLLVKLGVGIDGGRLIKHFIGKALQPPTFTGRQFANPSAAGRDLNRLAFFGFFII